MYYVIPYIPTYIAGRKEGMHTITYYVILCRGTDTLTTTRCVNTRDAFSKQKVRDAEYVYIIIILLLDTVWLTDHIYPLEDDIRYYVLLIT